MMFSMARTLQRIVQQVQNCQCTDRGLIATGKSARRLESCHLWPGQGPRRIREPRPFFGTDQQSSPTQNG